MEQDKKILKVYTPDGEKKPFEDWLIGLKDPMSRARIQTRLDRVAAGNFGDSKSIGEGVFELRFTFGAGFRVYYGLDGNTIVVLLTGGDKSSQESDVNKAKQYWLDYKGVKNE